MDFSQLTLEAFTAALASGEPVPGGGGAAALTGAAAASLAAMAAAVTKANPRYQAFHDELEGMENEAGRLRRAFLVSIEADAKAFAPLSEAYRIPKDRPDRAEVLERCLRTAAEPPLAMTALCADLVDLLVQLRSIASPMILSDVACSAVLAGAALKTAAVNVEVNTRLMKDREEAEARNRQVNQLLEKYLPLSDEAALKARAGK